MKRRTTILIDNLKGLSLEKDRIVFEYKSSQDSAKAMLEIQEEIEVAIESGELDS